MSHGYQCGQQRQAWNIKALPAATKKPVWKHKSISTPPLSGACAACHCQGPVMDNFPGRTQCTSGCCNVTLASATRGLPCITYSSLSLAWVSQIPLISCYFNPVLSEQRKEALRQPTSRGGAKSKAEPQELCKQRREREISHSNIRSSGSNLHNELDLPCTCGIPELLFFPFSLFVSVYMYASLCDAVCIALLFPFVPGFSLSIFFFFLGGDSF